MNILMLKLLLFSGIIRSQNKIIIELSAIEINGGTIYLSLFNSESSINRKQAFHELEIQPDLEKKEIKLSLPCGDYYFSAFQDHNNNGTLYNNIHEMPKEKVAINNYNAKNNPGGFSKHKIIVSDSTRYIKTCINLF